MTNENKNSFKNDILSKMLLEFSEKNHLVNSLIGNDKLDDKNCSNEKKAYENFTEDFVKEQYPAYFQDNFITPNEFTLTKKGTDENSKNVDKINLLIEKNNTLQKTKFQLKNYNLFKWLNAYSQLYNTEVQSIDLAFSNLKKYSFNSNLALCEVKRITIIDCIQIISVIDITLKKKNIILTKYDYTNNNSNENINNIINDYFLKVGDLFLCKFSGKNEPEKDYIKINIREIQKIT